MKVIQINTLRNKRKNKKEVKESLDVKRLRLSYEKHILEKEVKELINILEEKQNTLNSVRLELDEIVL